MPASVATRKIHPFFVVFILPSCETRWREPVWNREEFGSNGGGGDNGGGSGVVVVSSLDSVNV